MFELPRSPAGGRGARHCRVALRAECAIAQELHCNPPGLPGIVAIALAHGLLFSLRLNNGSVIMRRRDFAKIAAIGAVGAVAAPAVARAQTTFNWKMTKFYGPNAAFYSTGPAAPRILSAGSTMSTGRLKIQFYGAELIPAAEGFDAVSSGTVEMNYANSYFWTGRASPRSTSPRAVRIELPGLQRLVRTTAAARRALGEVYDRVQSGADPAVSTGVQMTGVVPQGDQDRRRLQGRQDAHPGLAGRVYGAWRRCPADRAG